ncbi:MAG: recombinase family protein [Leptolyngbyaceae cyanobacterium]
MSVWAYVYIDPLLDPPWDDTYDWGESVEQIYQDWGDRHQFQQLLTDSTHGFETDAEAGPHFIRRLLIRHLWELGDSVADVRDRLQHLEDLKIQVVAVEEDYGGGDRPMSPADQLRTFQQLQQIQHQRTLQRGHAQNRIQTKPPPGKAPYGYRRGKDRYILDRSTAPVVKDFFDHFLLYGSLRRSVRYLAQKYNKKISVSTGKRWLSNPVYRGHLAYTTGDVITHTHAAILSDDEAAQVDRLLRRNRQVPPRSASAERSLSGLVRCGQCQSPMTVTHVTQRGKKRDYLYLRPTQCPFKSTSSSPPNSTRQSTSDPAGEPTHQSAHPSPLESPKPCSALPYEAVLTQTIDTICATLPKIVETAPLPNLDGIKQQIQQQIQAKEEAIAQLPGLEQQGILDADTVALRTYALRSEMATLQASLAQLPPVNLKATVKEVALRQFWLDLSESERRFYFREFIHHIEIVRSPTDLSHWHVQPVLLLEQPSP